MTPPTPSTAASSSTSAARRASMEPKRAARARAAVGPTWRMDRATSTRARGWDLARSISSSICVSIFEAVVPTRS